MATRGRARAFFLAAVCWRRYRRVLVVLSVSCSIWATSPPLQAQGPEFDPTALTPPHASSIVSRNSKRPITSLDLLQLRDLHGVQVSPNGKYIAYVAGQALLRINGYRSALFVVGTEPGSESVNLGSAGTPHWSQIGEWDDDPPLWSKDSQQLYYRMEQSGRWQVWRWKLTGGPPEQVTHTEYSVKSFEIAPDGAALVLTVEHPPFTAQEIGRLASHGLLFDGSIETWQSKPFLDEYVESQAGNTETWIHDLRTNAEHQALGNELKRVGPWESDLDEKVINRMNSKDDLYRGHHILSTKVSPDGTRVAYTQYLEYSSQSARSSVVLNVKPVRGGQAVVLTPGAYYVADYWWSSDSSTIYYVIAEADGHSAKLMKVSSRGGSPQQIAPRSAELRYCGQYSVSASEQKVVAVCETNTSPEQVVALDVQSGTTYSLVNLNPEFQQIQLSPAERVEVTNKYGDSYHGSLVLPTNYIRGRRYPLVINTYRSGDHFLRGSAGDEYPIQVFAAGGMAVLEFDVGRDRNFDSGDFQAALLQWESPVQGMAEMVNQLVQRGVVDGSRVGITGLSHGDEMVHYAIAHKGFLAVAVASGTSGARDPWFFYLGGRQWQAMFARWGLGGWPEGKAAANWRRLSTTMNADRVGTPILMNVSDSEFLDGLDEVTSLEQLNKPVEVFVYPNELHIKNQPQHRFEIYNRNVDWLRYWLLGYEDPDPSKSEQYRRWEHLCDLQRAQVLAHPTSCINGNGY